MLLRNEDEQEVISRERKDRRDFEQLSQLAERMDLYRYFVAPSDILTPHMLYHLSDDNSMLLQPSVF